MNTSIYVRDRDGNDFLQFKGQRFGVAWRMPFIYQVPVFSNLAAGAVSAPNNVLIDASSLFVWTHGVYEFDLAAAAYTYETRPMPNMLLTINDGGWGRNLQNVPVPIGTRFGAVEKPIELPLPYVFAQAATISFTVTNFDAAVANGNLRLSLIGEQVYVK